MKPCDYYRTLVDGARRYMTTEIKTALKAYGGDFSWKEDGDDYPIVAANPDNPEPEPMDVCIWRLKLDGGHVRVWATGKLSGEPVDMGLENVFVEHLEFILDYMKAPRPIIQAKKLNDYDNSSIGF